MPSCMIRWQAVSPSREGRLLFWIAVAFSLYQISTALNLFGLPSQVMRSIHLGFLLLLTYTLIGAVRPRRPPVKALAWALALAAVGVAFYQCIEYQPLILRAGSPTTIDTIVGVATLVTVFGAAWLIMGAALPIISGCFLFYCFFGQYFPGPLQTRGYDFTQVIDHMTFGQEGIYGIPIYVSATYIFLFILFGSFLERAGMIRLFTDVSLGFVGHARGGAAKVAVISSGLMGTISGSGVANVVTTGQFTIPLMKSFGYRAAFAGGVEATSSMGGQIMPPVMGAVAFIMAETLDVHYYEIVKAALIPAILYFASAFWMVHLEAGKYHLLGLPKSELPSPRKALQKGWYLILPLAVLVFLLFSGYTPLYAGTIGLAMTVLLILGGSIALGLPSALLRVDLLDRPRPRLRELLRVGHRADPDRRGSAHHRQCLRQRRAADTGRLPRLAGRRRQNGAARRRGLRHRRHHHRHHDADGCGQPPSASSSCRSGSPACSSRSS